MTLIKEEYYLNKHNGLFQCIACGLEFCTNYSKCKHLILVQVPYQLFTSIVICPQMDTSLDGLRVATIEEVLIHLL